jgi:signal transduction histidine kinase
MVLVFPIKSPGGIIHGFLVLGAKKSGQRFLKDYIDLLNTVTAAIALSIDRIKLQEELVKEQLKAQRLEEIKNLQSFFVSAITHELRTPLQAIKSFAELLQSKRLLIQEKLLEYSQIIEGESDKLSRLIDNILDFKKIETGKEIYDKSCIEVNSIIKQTVKSMQYQFNMSRKILKENIHSGDVQINGDSKAIELAVLNLLSNALKYSRESSVTELKTFLKDQYYCIAIRDEGKGIDKEHLSKIFEAFYRVKGETVRGTGIGLALVKHIMDAHDGKIEVISEPGKGSTFTLLFPIAKNEENINN